MKKIVLLLISGYQKYISPYKGYRCAYAALTGNSSCSEFVKRSVKQDGIAMGITAYLFRTKMCNLALIALNQSKEDEEDENGHCGDSCKPYVCGAVSGCSLSSRSVPLGQDFR